MNIYVSALYKILNYVCENQRYFMEGDDVCSTKGQTGIIKGLINYKGDEIDYFIIEDYFKDILSILTRDLLLEDVSLNDFIVWLSDKGYLPAGLDKRLRTRGSIKFINGLPSLVVHIKIDVNQLKSDTLNEEPEAKE